MKTLRKVLAIILIVCMVMSLTSLGAFADRGNGYEYIQIFINNSSWKVISGNSDSWLIKGEYGTPQLSLNGKILTYTIGNQKNKSVELPIPDNAENIKISYDPSVSVNSHSATYDNAKIYLTFTEITVDNTVYHPGSTSISVTKAVSGEGAVLEAGQFSFTLTETDANWTPNGGYSATATNAANGTVSFPSISYSTAGTYYYIVTENAGDLDNWSYSDYVERVTVNVIDGEKDGNNVFLWAGASYAGGRVFTNTYTEPAPEPSEPPYEPVHTLGSLTIAKVNIGAETPADAVFTVSGPEGYSKSFTYADFVNGLYTIDGLAEGSYSVVETNADIDYHTLTVTYTDDVTLVKNTADNGDTSVSSGRITVTNDYFDYTTPPPSEPPYEPVHSLGSLTIAKVSSGAETPADAVFTVSGPEGYSKSFTYAEFVNGLYTIDGLAEGSYSVFETGADIDYYSLAVTYTDDITLVKTTAENGDTAVDSGTITVTNTYTESSTPPPVDPPVVPPVEEPEFGSLVIAKTSVGADTPAKAVFTIEGPDGYELEVEYSEFVDGKYELTDLEPGTYTVSESKAGIFGYSLKVSGNDTNVEVVAGERANVMLVNNYTRYQIIPTPETPETPEVPETPDVPVVPEVPVVPDTPVVPDEPVDIPDEEVPLAPPPVIDLEDIPDEEVPLAQAPQTGDSFLFWVIAAAISALGLAVVSIKLRKNED